MRKKGHKFFINFILSFLLATLLWIYSIIYKNLPCYLHFCITACSAYMILPSNSESKFNDIRLWNKTFFFFCTSNKKLHFILTNMSYHNHISLAIHLKNHFLNILFQHYFLFLLSFSSFIIIIKPLQELFTRTNTYNIIMKYAAEGEFSDMNIFI
jgi:hypothetical protein